MEYREIAETNQIEEGQMKTAVIEGRIITVAKVEGRYFAFDDVCTHEECSLATGYLEGKTIECPCHGSKFNVETGAVANLPAVVPIKTYPVKVEGNSILVGL